jgi:RNA polymerase sigma factor (sigma-70 family)
MEICDISPGARARVSVVLAPGGLPWIACVRTGCPLGIRILYARHAGLVGEALRRTGPGRRIRAEAAQAARIGLWQAIVHFDPEAGEDFTAYARRSIRRRISKVVRRETFPSAEIPAAAYGQDGRTGPALQEELECLPVRLRDVLVENFGLNGAAPRALQEIAEEWGLSQQRVQQLRHKALELLRRQMMSPRQFQLYRKKRYHDQP